MDKTAVQILRECVDESKNMSSDDIEEYPSIVLTKLLAERYDVYGERDAFLKLADMIELDYLPKPRYADGSLVQVGDIVYGLENPIESYTVSNDGEYVIYSDIDEAFGSVPVKVGRSDSQERIDEDANKVYSSYWGCTNVFCEDCPAEIDGNKPKEAYGCATCSMAMTLDLLRRQRELDAKEAR